MKTILVPTKSPKDWQGLLAKPDRQWKQGRSAMTLALAWEAAADHFPAEVGRVLGANGEPTLGELRVIVAIPEFQVDLPGGVRPSQTDLMVVATNTVGLCVIAVEGKVDEAFGPTVTEKGAEASEGQQERIAFLLGTLGLQGSSAGHLRYQLLHRTVSAVLTARQFHAGSAMMMVHSFGRSKDIFADYEAFCRALGVHALPDEAVRVPGLERPNLYLAWCEGESKYLSMNA